jgi:hypothetical protein
VEASWRERVGSARRGYLIGVEKAFRTIVLQRAFEKERRR